VDFPSPGLHNRGKVRFSQTCGGVPGPPWLAPTGRLQSWPVTPLTVLPVLPGSAGLPHRWRNQKEHPLTVPESQKSCQGEKRPGFFGVAK
jgi:hypothetical protein